MTLITASPSSSSSSLSSSYSSSSRIKSSSINGQNSRLSPMGFVSQIAITRFSVNIFSWRTLCITLTFYTCLAIISEIHGLMPRNFIAAASLLLHFTVFINLVVKQNMKRNPANVWLRLCKMLRNYYGSVSYYPGITVAGKHNRFFPPCRSLSLI